MKKIYLPLLILMFANIVQAHPGYTGRSAQVMQPGQGCTVFYAASSDLAFAGNNEDFSARLPAPGSSRPRMDVMAGSTSVMMICRRRAG